MIMKEGNKTMRPEFLSNISDSYFFKRKNIITLTGDINGLFFDNKNKSHISLEQIINSELKSKFNIVRLDISSGISFYDKETEDETIRICESTDGYYTPSKRITALKKMISESRHHPLSALVLLSGMVEAFERVRRLESNIKPLCIVIQFAGAIFTAGDYSHLSDIDKQCLISFLGLTNSPLFRNSPELVILINSVRSEINQKVLALPHGTHIEINLPNYEERKNFTNIFIKENRKTGFDGKKSDFIEDTAGLSINNIKDILEVSARRGTNITKSAVVDEVNTILQAQLGDIIRIKRPSHSSKDIVGYKETGKIITDVFERCNDPETAIAAILVSGPNGSGKTFQLEAFAADSGRVVIELAGIRGSYFGETDKFFELLRWHISTYGKILILVDEAHTAFGSVHASQTHQTEQRLAGNIIKMMGNPQYLGKVLWGLMTSRPDEIDPDIKSRAPVQIPIFDLEGDERKAFVREMFKRKKIILEDEALDKILKKTDYYSARDYRNFVAEVLAIKKKNNITPLEVLSGWQASKSIKRERQFQEIIAALHCSYPTLLPEKYRNISDNELIKISEDMKMKLF